MIIEEDIYLEHFGVKGMHWGVRKSQNHPDVGNRKRSKRGGTPEQKRAGTKKFARNLAVGAGVGIAGGLVVGAILKRSGAINIRTSQVSRMGTTRNGQKVASRILKTNPDLRMRALKASAASRSGPTMKSEAAKHLSSVNSVNKTLASWYNQNNVPLPQRKMIDTSHWKRLAG